MLNKYDLKKKEAIRLNRRSNEIWEEKRKIPDVELEEPYQSGWLVFMDLDQAYNDHEDAMLLRQVIDLSFKTHRETKVQHVKLLRKGLHGYYTTINKKREFIQLIPHITRISEDVYSQLPSRAQDFFELVKDGWKPKLDRFGKKEYKPDYHILQYAKARTVPYIITHQKGLDGKLIAEEKRINDRLYHTESLYYKYVEGKTYDRKRFNKEKYRAKTRDDINKFKQGIIEDIDNYVDIAVWD